MAYDLSAFWLPLDRALGITEPLTCSADVSLVAELFITTCDWHVSNLDWMFMLLFVSLGASAAM